MNSGVKKIWNRNRTMIMLLVSDWVTQIRWSSPPPMEMERNETIKRISAEHFTNTNPIRQFEYTKSYNEQSRQSSIVTLSHTITCTYCDLTFNNSNSKLLALHLLKVHNVGSIEHGHSQCNFCLRSCTIWKISQPIKRVSILNINQRNVTNILQILNASYV